MRDSSLTAPGKSPIGRRSAHAGCTTCECIAPGWPRYRIASLVRATRSRTLLHARRARGWDEIATTWGLDGAVTNGRALVTSRPTTSHVDAASELPAPPRDARQEPPFYEGSFVKPPIVGTHCGMRPRRFGAAPFGATIHFPFLHPIRPLRSSRVRCCGSRLTAAALAAPGHCRLSVLGDGSAPASGTPYPSCAPRARRAVGGPLSVLVSAQSPARVPVVPRTHPLSNSVALGDRQPGLPFGGSGGVLPSCGP